MKLHYLVKVYNKTADNKSSIFGAERLRFNYRLFVKERALGERGTNEDLKLMPKAHPI